MSIKKGHSSLPPILEEGRSCWRKVPARRAAFLMDVKAHFSCTLDVLKNARHSILLVGWDFDPRTKLRPDSYAPGEPAQFGHFLISLKDKRPDLDIKILIWHMALPIACFRDYSPQRARRWFKGRVDFRLDSPHTIGAAHHQKILVVDDEIAFCTGCDFAANRWDVPSHPDRLIYRYLPSGKAYKPRHEVSIMVEGEAAYALGDVARERWRKATGETVAARKGTVNSLWPASCPPSLENTEIAIMRTEPKWHSIPAVRECEIAYLDAIAAARDLIYLENQYFASPVIGDALEARLREREGPEIVVLCAAQAPSFFDQIAMDTSRDALVAKLRKADRYGRLQVYRPRTPGGRTIVLHSKVACFDDRLIRIGSTNLNNRSFGYDSECDVAIEATGPEAPQTAQAIAAFRNKLIGHFLGVSTEEFAKAYATTGSAIKAIASLDKPRKPRLKIIRGRRPHFPRSLIARWHLGDPVGVDDAWRPWRRVAYLKERRAQEA